MKSRLLAAVLMMVWFGAVAPAAVVVVTRPYVAVRVAPWLFTRLRVIMSLRCIRFTGLACTDITGMVMDTAGVTTIAATGVRVCATDPSCTHK